MPIYEYTCEDCGAHFDKFVRSISAQVEAKCPTCGSSHVKKGWSVFGTAGTDSSSVGLSSGSSACSTGST